MTFSSSADVCYNTIEIVTEEYSEHTPERVESSELENMLVKYLTWLANQLSEFGKVSFADVQAKLTEIGF